MDSPAEYIAKLEVENRALRGEIRRLTDELKASDELRAGVVSAAADTAQNMQIALDRLAQWQPIVDAAIAWDQGEESGLDAAVRQYTRTIAKKASS